MKKKIVLDVDGVMLDFANPFQDLVRELYPREHIIHEHIFDFRPRMNLSDQEFKHILNTFYGQGFMERLPAYEGVKEAVAQLKEQDYDIYVVTGIDPLYKEQRLANLLDIDLVPKEIHCTGFGATNKSDIIKQINPDYFVDDLISHLHEAKFVKNLVWIERPYSQHEEHFVDFSYATHSDLQSFVKSLKPNKTFKM